VVTRLSLQRLSRVRDRVLALGQIVTLRNADGSFTPAEVERLAEELRLPRIGNASRELARLKSDELVVRLTAGGWAITPEGDHVLLSTIGKLDSVEAPAPATSGADLGEVRHQIIPASLAPEPWIGAIGHLLDDHPFERNVLLITRFPANESDPLWAFIPKARAACKQHGLELHVAGDRNADPLLFNNVAGYMWACRFGLALFEAHGDPPRRPASLNQNLLIEVGSMLMTGRRCAILRDTSVEQMPTDLVGHIFHPVRFEDLGAAIDVLHRALVADFGTKRCSECP